MRYKSQTKEKNNGVVYTPTAMANYIAHEIVTEYEFGDTSVVKVLDPALGEGELVLAVVSAIKTAHPDKKISVYGYDIDPMSVEKSKIRIREAFPDVITNFMVQDFLSVDACGNDFDIVIANPPYVRTQILGEGISKRLAEKFGLKGKIDVYYAFFMVSLSVLKEGGVAGFITSNKFLTINSGKTLREYLYQNAEILTISDFGDTRIFDSAVLPSVTIFKKVACFSNEEYRVKFNSIYLDDETSDEREVTSVNSVYDCIAKNGVFVDGKGVQYKAKSGYALLTSGSCRDPWVISTNLQEKWLERIAKNTWRTFSEVGKVRVGIKTTADNVFLFDKNASAVDLELMKPLITHRNAQCFLSNNSEQWSVLYPHYEENGKRRVYDIEQYPKTRKYLLQHFEQLDKRKYVKKAKRAWYEIWVPQKPSSWKHQKIVFRDISQYPQFWLVSEEAVINGDCYWIEFPENADEDVIYLMLAVANSKFIVDFYDNKFNTKLYSSKRRFMTQYVEQFPIPDKNRRECKEIVELVKMILKTRTLEPGVKDRIDSLVESVFS